MACGLRLRLRDQGLGQLGGYGSTVTAVTCLSATDECQILPRLGFARHLGNSPQLSDVSASFESQLNGKNTKYDVHSSVRQVEDYRS